MQFYISLLLLFPIASITFSLQVKPNTMQAPPYTQAPPQSPYTQPGMNAFQPGQAPGGPAAPYGPPGSPQLMQPGAPQGPPPPPTPPNPALNCQEWSWIKYGLLGTQLLGLVAQPVVICLVLFIKDFGHKMLKKDDSQTLFIIIMSAFGGFYCAEFYFTLMNHQGGFTLCLLGRMAAVGYWVYYTFEHGYAVMLVLIGILIFFLMTQFYAELKQKAAEAEQAAASAASNPEGQFPPGQLPPGMNMMMMPPQQPGMAGAGGSWSSTMPRSTTSSRSATSQSRTPGSTATTSRPSKPTSRSPVSATGQNRRTR